MSEKSKKPRFKFIKSLIGIETEKEAYQNHHEARFKFIKSLIGIETIDADGNRLAGGDSNSSNP